MGSCVYVVVPAVYLDITLHLTVCGRLYVVCRRPTMHKKLVAIVLAAMANGNGNERR